MVPEGVLFLAGVQLNSKHPGRILVSHLHAHLLVMLTTKNFLVAGNCYIGAEKILNLYLIILFRRSCQALWAVREAGESLAIGARQPIIPHSPICARDSNFNFVVLNILFVNSKIVTLLLALGDELGNVVHAGTSQRRAQTIHLLFI